MTGLVDSGFGLMIQRARLMAGEEYGRRGTCQRIFLLSDCPFIVHLTDNFPLELVGVSAAAAVGLDDVSGWVGVGLHRRPSYADTADAG